MPLDSQSPAYYACLSRRLHNLIQDFDFLDTKVVYFPTRLSSNPSAIVSWGEKKWSPLATWIANKKDIQHIRLEDGFLRSFGLGIDGKQPLSIVVDGPGIHYDPNRASRIEDILDNTKSADLALITRARAGIELIRDNRLSKYNLWQKPDRNTSRFLDKPYVLVVDQVKEDASVKASGFTDAMAEQLISTARKENPGKTILIKTHPDVTSGKKRSCLEGFWPDDAIVIDQAIDPWYLLESQPTVYTVSSLLGLEALIAGCKVRCFGGPFYAGWGLTEDELVFERRQRKLTLEELFAGAYLLYPRYVDPYTGTRSDFETVASTLADWKQFYVRRQPKALCVGVSKWKQKRVNQLLQFGGIEVQHQQQLSPEAAAKLGDETEIICWPRKTPRELVTSKQKGEMTFTYLEDGFIRSPGLGAALVQPNSLVFDRQGIYFDPASRSELESLLATHHFTPALLSRAEELLELVNKNRITKYNIGSEKWDQVLPEGKRIILVPGQVEDDASIQLGTEDINTNLSLLRQVRKDNTKAFIIYKPHPDVEAGLRTGLISRPEVLRYADSIAENISAQTLLKNIHEVHTMTSTIGFEALCQGRIVHTYGRPFYAGWGLTNDKLGFSERNRKLSMAELVAGVLILYPVYFDPITQKPCGPELLVERLAKGEIMGSKSLLGGALHSTIGAIRRTLRQ